MATAQDTITRALRMINVLEPGETASADEASEALAVLNDMLHGWAKVGVDLNHATMSLTSEHTTHDSYLEGIRANLAVRLCEEYGRDVPIGVATRAQRYFSAFQAANLEFTDDMDIDQALHPRYFNMRQSGAYNIEDG